MQAYYTEIVEHKRQGPNHGRYMGRAGQGREGQHLTIRNKHQNYSGLLIQNMETR
jgi:hypothetical protein